MHDTRQTRTSQATQPEASRVDHRIARTNVSSAEHRPAAAQLRQLAAMMDSSARMDALRTQTAPIRNRPVQRQEAPRKPNHTGLPDNLKTGVESLSGMSMDHVKVHYNSPQPAQLNALAYAQGSDIHVAPGQEQHLPHEAWHVVQQAQGRVRPTMQMKDAVPVNDDAGLEREADVMGARAVSLGSEPLVAQRRVGPSGSPAARFSGVVQMVQLGDAVRKSDGWTRIVDDTGDWMAEITNETVTILVPKADYDAQTPNAVNNVPLQLKEMGCAVCVAADYFGTTAVALAGCGARKPSLRAPLLTIYKDNGYSDTVATFYIELGILGEIEPFDNYAAMVASLRQDPDAPAWTGALAWGGHIIRARGDGDTFRFWDPQLAIDPAAVPLDTALMLIHFPEHPPALP